MAQRTNTVEYAFEPGTAGYTTVTALAGTNYYTAPAITAHIAETTATRTIRSVELIVTGYFTGTTAYTLDGARISTQIDAVAWSDLSLTGTGIGNTGDPYSFVFSGDMTAYFVTNFTGASHTVGARVEIETATAASVNNMCLRLRITYEYNDTSATYTKTVRIPLESNTGFASTSANANVQGSTGAAQIPALTTFLPEYATGGTFRQIFFEILATDGGAATTDFTASMSIEGGTTHTTGNIEANLNGSTVFQYLWIPGGGDGTSYFDETVTRNFQFWSSLASRFERLTVTCYVTYTYTAPTSGTIINSIIVPLQATHIERVPGTATADKQRFRMELWVEEPTTITLVQSALRLYYAANGAGNLDVRVNSQGSTSSVYTTTALLHGGTHMLQHRIDVAHGGTAVTLARGRNVLTVDVFSSVTTNVGPSGISGFFIINYTSGLHASGIGVHNHTTFWKIWTTHEGAIAGDSYRSVATTNQRTPNLPETAWFNNGIGLDFRMNATGATTGMLTQLLAEVASGEHDDDGWFLFSNVLPTDGEFGPWYQFLTSNTGGAWDKWAGDINNRMDPETARVWRFNSTHVASWGVAMVMTYHAITFSATRAISGSGGGTVNVDLFRADNDEKVAETSRVGDGNYTVTWYDSTLDYYTVAYEDATHVARSANFSLA